MQPVLSTAFDEASAAVVAYLREHVPLGMWTVSRYDGERQVYLALEDGRYGVAAGDSVPWSDTLCQYSVAGVAPHVAPDAMAVPQYASAPVATRLAIGTYVGMPITLANGEVFGTLCGIDPDRRPKSFTAHTPLLVLLTALLTRILDADLERAAALRDAASAEVIAETDVLTGLLNRRGWDRMLDVHEQRARRFGEPCALVMLDLDGLKRVNDEQGHERGDALLQAAAGALRTAVRSNDVAARLGGDEFGVIAAGATARDAARLVRRIERAFAASGVRCSLGCVQLSGADGGAASMRRADEIMYAAKLARRGPDRDQASCLAIA